jgi:hypothetical protein
MADVWKPDFEATKRRFVAWWDRRGMVLNPSALPAARAHADVPPPGPAPESGEWWHDPEWFAAKVRYDLSRREYPADALPMARINTGPGALATLLGSEPVFEPGTVWYRPCIADPETHPPLGFDRDAPWWKIHEALLRAAVRQSEGSYLVGCPDLIENFDTYASLRDSQLALVDLYDRPGFVKEKIAEINQAFFDAFDAIYDIIRLPDGSSSFWAFDLWSPGKCAKVQCDASAMLSPQMFREFVVPALTAQCAWLDRSMFHLDGSQCIVHLDALLEIAQLDAVEWTPDPKVPRGGDPHWYDMYRAIRRAGKSVQAIGVRPEEVVPLLDAVGPEGMYVCVGGLPREADERRKAVEELVRAVEPYGGPA